MKTITVDSKLIDQQNEMDQEKGEDDWFTYNHVFNNNIIKILSFDPGLKNLGICRLVNFIHYNHHKNEHLLKYQSIPLTDREWYEVKNVEYISNSILNNPIINQYFTQLCPERDYVIIEKQKWFGNAKICAINCVIESLLYSMAKCKYGMKNVHCMTLEHFLPIEYQHKERHQRKKLHVDYVKSNFKGIDVLSDLSHDEADAILLAWKAKKTFLIG
jgi:hypothetical protein